jgi:chaperonin GroES
VAKGVRLQNSPASADVKIGDHILFGEYSGAEIRLSGETYLMMRQDEIIRVVAEALDAEGEIAS